MRTTPADFPLLVFILLGDIIGTKKLLTVDVDLVGNELSQKCLSYKLESEYDLSMMDVACLKPEVSKQESSSAVSCEH